jgi:polysaccharide biosynthesis transport protein
MAGNLVPPKLSEALQAPSGVGLPQVPEDNGLAFPTEPVDDGGVQWSRYVAALRRYRWLILLITVLGTAAGVVATRFLKPLYSVQATIWIDNSTEASSGPIRAGGLLHSFAWQELLTTYTVLDSVIQKERLYLELARPADSLAFQGFSLKPRFKAGKYALDIDANGRFLLKTQQGLTMQKGTAGDSIGGTIGFAWQPPAAALGRDRTIKFTVYTPRQASELLQEDLSTQMAENGNFLRLSLTGTDPTRLASTLNTLTTQFVSVAADLKKGKLTETSKALEQQLDTIGQRLRQAESELEGYKTRIITQPSEFTAVAPGVGITQPTVMTQYFNQKVQIEEMRRDRQAIESVLQRARAGALAVDAFQTIPSVQTAPDLNKALGELSTAESELRALLYRYTPEAKQVQVAQERINTLRSQTIPAYASALANALREKESTLTQTVAGASRELQSIPSRAINEQRLMREVASLAAIHTDVQARYQQAKLAEASAIPDVKTLDSAVVPTKPSRNSAPRIILLAFAASLGLALGLAILLDQLDRRFRYPDQVTRELGLSILGAIPAISKVQPSERNPEEANQVVEAFRTVRMNLAHSYGAAGPILLTVTSPGPGDGKSLVSSNLALSFAEAGYKTLLIDGDIRRGELHRMFNTDRRPGLLDYLTGSVGMEDILRPSSHQRLTVIPCGTRLHHGPELLGSNAMREMIAAFKSRFNVIIVDSPPLGAGIDPFVLGTATGHMMIVLRSGETDRQMAEAKLKLLDRLPIRMLGAVLNDISASGVYKYYSYIYGYTADEETPQLAGTLGTEVGKSV